MPGTVRAGLGWRFTLDPLEPGLFQGRQLLVSDVLDAMTREWAPEYLYIHGPQKIGRSSLLKYLNAILKEARTASDERVVPAWLDLRLWSRGTAEDELIRAFLSVLVRASRVDVIDTSAPALVQLQVLVEELRSRVDQRLVLLLDHANSFVDSKQLRQLMLDLLGTLHDSIPSLGIVLSFGAQGEEMADFPTRERIERTEAVLSAISPTWLRARTLVLRHLPRQESWDYLGAATGRGAAGNGEALTDVEAEWILELAGDHPFLLNLVGYHLGRLRTWRHPSHVTSDERIELERYLVDHLVPMGHALLRRLRRSSDYHEILEFVQDLADGGPGLRDWPVNARDVHLVELLGDEGLVQLHGEERGNEHGPRHFSMASSLFRRMLRDQRIQRLYGGVGLDLDGGRSNLTLERRSAEPRMLTIRHGSRAATVRLTDIEYRIVARLLQAPEATVSVEDLVHAVWAEEPMAEGADRWNERLKQRITALRRKLRSYITGDSIINSYGSGYRLDAPDRYSLDS